MRYYSTFALWLAASNAQLQRSYGINFADAGASEDELASMYAAHVAERETIKDACDEYASDRDLDAPDAWTRKDLEGVYAAPAEPDADYPQAEVRLHGDPNYGDQPMETALKPTQGLAAGNGGSLLFDLTTGKVERHYPGTDWPVHHDGYLDIATIDIPALLKRRKVEAFEPRALFDITECGYTTTGGQYEEECPPFEEEAA